MGIEEKNSGTKRDDMTADELLTLLNKSIDYKPGEGDVEKALSNDRHTDTLQIDDEVYEAAADELKSSDAMTVADDSELDIDALIEKFISKPRDEREEAAKAEAAEAQIEDIIKEIERPEIPEDFSDDSATVEFSIAKDDEQDAQPSIGEIEGEADQLTIFDAMADGSKAEDVSLFAEPAPSYGDNAEEAMDAFDIEDADVKVAESFEDASDKTEAPADDTEKTAVFDISSIKKMAEEESLDEIEDQAFTHSETEIFTPVNEDEAAVVPVKETVYGSNSDEEIDQTDLDIMLAFGMNEELRETVGEDAATAIEDNILQRHEETAGMPAVQKTEFTSHEQATDILTQYKSKYYTLLARIGGAVALFIIMFLLENYAMLDITMPGFMRPTSYPVVYAMINLQLVVFGGVLVAPQVIRGVKSIIALKPTPESLTAFMLAVSALYTFIACFSAPMEGFALFNLPVIFTVVLALIYEFMNLKRDVLSFNVVSTKRKKFVVTPVSDETESLEREIFNEYVPENSRIVCVGKTDFVDGFFERTDDKQTPKPIIGIMMPVILILSVIFLIVTFIRTGNLYSSLTMGFITIMLTAPLASFVVYSYPFYKASKDAYSSGSAIIGDASFEEYAGASVISFEDKEVFPSGGVKVTSIKVYGNNRIDEIIYCLASAFIKVGGPLSDVFNQATHDLGHSEDVELIGVEDDGFTVTIDDVTVHIGKASYMEKNDYEPPFDSEGKKREQAGAIGVLYVAFGGQLAAKVYIQYTIDSEFEAILSQLYKTGMCVGIKSFDPNIDDLLLAKKIKAMKYPVKVIRSRTVEDIPHTVERADSGIVSKRSVKALLKTVALCERAGNVVNTNIIIKMLAMLIGVVIMIFISAFGNSISLSSLYVMLYQLFWTIPVFAISKFLI